MDDREKLVNVALGELGISAPAGNRQYIAWYNQAVGTSLAPSVSWCAIFVSWCARKAGVCVEAIPNYASCTQAVGLFKKYGVWKAPGSYVPTPGNLIFFDWNRDPSASEHTGVVTGVQNGWVQTVEGNSGAPGAVRRKSYHLNSTLILGYAAWTACGTAAGTDTVRAAQRALNERYGGGMSVDGIWGTASRAAAVRAVQTEINTVYNRKLAVDGSFGPASRAACPTLRRGDTNGLVWMLQLLLSVTGGGLTLDQRFGPDTERVVKAFQVKHGLQADGLAGSGTFAALLQ